MAVSGWVLRRGGADPPSAAWRRLTVGAATVGWVGGSPLTLPGPVPPTAGVGGGSDSTGTVGVGAGMTLPASTGGAGWGCDAAGTPSPNTLRHPAPG